MRQDIVDEAILGAITEVLQPAVLTLAVEKALAKLAYARSHHTSRRARLEGELMDVQRKLDRLVDALADGLLPPDEIRERLNTEKARKTTLQAKLEELDQLGRVASIDIAELKRQFESRASDVTALLAKQTVQARQMLRKLLADKIELEPVGSGRERGYKFRGALTVEKLISGEAFAQVKNTSVCGGPNGT